MRLFAILRQMVFVAATVLLITGVLLPPVSAQPAAPTATVIVATLNVRSGPGTTYARIGQVSNGTKLTVLGQAQNCAWLNVKLPAGGEGWVAGPTRYTKLNVACSAVPAAKTGASSTAQGGATATPAPAVPTASPAATATPVPPTPAPSEPDAADPLPPELACYLVQNYVGPELNVTFTNQDTGKGETFKVPAGGEVVRCVQPGRYTATIDAPPPWGTLDTEFKANAGDRLYMPFYARE